MNNDDINNDKISFSSRKIALKKCYIPGYSDYLPDLPWNAAR